MRRAVALTMVVVAAVLLAGAAIAWYADDTLVDDQEFATRLPSALDDGDVRGVVADQIVTGVTSSAVRDALIVRPLIVPLVAVVVDAPVFRRTVHRAEVRRRLLGRDPRRVHDLRADLAPSPPAAEAARGALCPERPRLPLRGRRVTCPPLADQNRLHDAGARDPRTIRTP